MKANCPTINEITQMDFSDNFHNIKNSYKLTIFKEIRKTASFFLFAALKKPLMVRKNFQSAKMNAYKCQIIV